MRIIFILMLCAYLGGNFYIFNRGMQSIHTWSLSIKWIVGILYWLCTLSIGLTFALNSKEKADGWGHPFFQFSTGWLVFTLYMVMLLLCFDFFKLFNRSFHYGFIISLVLTISILIYGYIRYQQPVTHNINIDINKSLTDSTTTHVKIVAVSDIHLGLGTNRTMLKKYVQMIEYQNPDLILISGDLIDNNIRTVQEARMADELEHLTAPLGIYMVPGNHEYISGIQDCAEYITSKTPIQLLRDSVIILPNGIQIVGRDDRSNAKRKSLSQLMTKVNPDFPVLVLDHQPVELIQVQESNADLLFCGHTHNGQVWPLNLLTSRLFNISYGFEKRDNTNIYVSSGLALWGPPFRIGSRCEMIVFNLSFKQP